MVEQDTMEGTIHGPNGVVANDLRFWSFGVPLPPPPRRSLLAPPRGLLPPMPKVPPTLLLVSTFCPSKGNPTPSPIKDGLPFHSL